MHFQLSSFLGSFTLLTISLSNIGPHKPKFTEFNTLQTWIRPCPLAQTDLQQVNERHSFFQLLQTGNINKGSEIAYLYHLSSVNLFSSTNFRILRFQDKCWKLNTPMRMPFKRLFQDSPLGHLYICAFSFHWKLGQSAVFYSVWSGK